MKLIDVPFCISLTVMVLLVSCQLETEPAIKMASPTITTGNVQAEATSGTVPPASTLAYVTPGMIPESTLAMPSISTVTFTPMSLQPTIPMRTATPTPWPTLFPTEAAEKVLSLLADSQNVDCLLPCWWGAVPGQTYWQEIEPFLRSFATKIDETPRGALVKLPLPEPIAVPDFGYYVSYGWNDSGIIREISVKSMNVPGYDPKTIVTLYGISDEVWLKTLDAPLEGVLPFQLIIVYQEQGISLRYYMNASTDGKTVTACFEPGVVETERPDLFPAGPRIYLWEPGQPKTIDEIANIPEEIYYPLEEKTDMTLATFYERFTDPNERACIDTPADLWE